MNLIKFDNGHFALAFTPIEMAQFRSALCGDQLQLQLQEEPNEEAPDPTKKLRKTTLQFREQAKKYFNGQIIKRDDKVLATIERDLYIKDLASILNSLAKRGLCEITRKPGDKRNRIESFRIL